MDGLDASTGRVTAPIGEDAQPREQQIAREAELLTQARLSAAAGSSVSDAQVDAWIDSLGTEHELPPPRSSR